MGTEYSFERTTTGWEQASSSATGGRTMNPKGTGPCRELVEVVGESAMRFGLSLSGRAPYASTMGTRLKVAVCRADVEHAPIVAEGTFEPGSDVVLGADTTCTLVVSEWEGPPIRLISGDGFLHLAEGMRVNMCGDGGASRIMGTYDELNAADTPLPIPILQRRLNVTVRKGLSVFAKYVEGSG